MKQLPSRLPILAKSVLIPDENKWRVRHGAGRRKHTLPNSPLHRHFSPKIENSRKSSSPSRPARLSRKRSSYLGSFAPRHPGLPPPPPLFAEILAHRHKRPSRFQSPPRSNSMSPRSPYKSSDSRHAQQPVVVSVQYVNDIEFNNADPGRRKEQQHHDSEHKNERKQIAERYGAQGGGGMLHESFKADNSHALEDYIHSLLYSSYMVAKLKETSKNFMQNVQEGVTAQMRCKQHNLEGGCHLVFFSDIESGNLDQVFQVGERAYDLYMRVDTNTFGHQQWFYFRMAHLQPEVRYKFRICNFTKNKSLFQKGLKPVWRVIGGDWQFWHAETRYFKNSIQRKGLASRDYIEDDIQVKSSRQKQRKKRYYYTLEMTGSFADFPQDTLVELAYMRPYTYTDMWRELGAIETLLQLEGDVLNQVDSKRISQKKESLKVEQEGGQDQQSWLPSLQDLREEGIDRVLPQKLELRIQTPKLIYERKILCKTLCNLPVPVITVTGHPGRGLPLRKRPAAFVTGRVHPGESNGSMVMQGFLNFLLFGKRGDEPADPRAEGLRDWYIFKVIPMLNPDGVVCGNYRSTVSGVDLNRKWTDPHPQLHPIAFHARKLVAKVQKERRVLVFCDLHGHSKAQNAFIYGCGRAAEGEFSSWTKVRLLPRVLAKHTHFFNYAQCRFKVTTPKQGTARVVLWKDFGVTNSFTLETSFAGYCLKSTKATARETEVVYEQRSFKQQDFQQIGCCLGRSLAQFYLLHKQIERETALTNGWLKPIKLIQMTGSSAVEKIIKEIEAKQRLKKRQQFITDYLAKLGRGGRSRVDSAGYELSVERLSDDATVILEQGSRGSLAIPPSKKSSRSLVRRLQSGNLNQTMFSSLEIEPESKKYESALLSRVGTPPSVMSPNIMIEAPQSRRQQREQSIGRFYSQLQYFQMQHQERNNYRETQSHEHELERSMQRWDSSLKVPEWRQFFAENELENAFEKIQRGQSPDESKALPMDLRNQLCDSVSRLSMQSSSESEEDDDLSDSEASLDNMDENRLNTLEVSPEQSVSITNSPKGSPRHATTIASDFRVRLQSLCFQRSQVSPIHEQEQQQQSLTARKKRLTMTTLQPLEDLESRDTTPHEVSELDRVSSKASEISKITGVRRYPLYPHHQQRFITDIKIRSQERQKRSPFQAGSIRCEENQAAVESRSRIMLPPRYSKGVETASQQNQAVGGGGNVGGDFVVLPLTKINFPAERQTLPLRFPFLKKLQPQDQFYNKARAVKIQELKLRRAIPPNTLSMLHQRRPLPVSKFRRTHHRSAGHSQEYSSFIKKRPVMSTHDRRSTESEHHPTESSSLWDSKQFNPSFLEDLAETPSQNIRLEETPRRIVAAGRKELRRVPERRVDGLRPRESARRGLEAEEDEQGRSRETSRSPSEKEMAREIGALVASMQEGRNMAQYANSAKKKKARETAKLLGFSPFHSNF